MPRLPDVLASLSLLLGAALVAPGAGAAPVPHGTWPLDPVPEVAAGFAPPAQDWEAGHRGADLRGAPGQWVRSALPGRISFAGKVAGKEVVVVDHGATRTTYEPVRADLAVGEEVAAGDRIGWLLAAPSHCAPATCLHWGWREGDRYLDPLLLVGERPPVRLLPLWSQLPVPGPAGVGLTAPASGARVGLAIGGA